MAKWTKEELLCNARGLDDGYLFVHSSHPLAQKLNQVLGPGKTAKSTKLRLTDSSSYGCPGFTGSVRPPLSNEIYLIDEDVSIPPPSTSSTIELSSHDNLFTEPIISNMSVCVAFTEPAKLSHKSILLPGAVLSKPCLTDDDRRIRRPRLSRGGGTIAHMGGASNNNSHQSGYGSMNISSYERDLAQRTGRGGQMYQAGTRAWGAMEPTPKRPYQPSNPFLGQGGRFTQAIPPPNPPPWQAQRQQGGGYDHAGTGYPNRQYQHQSQQASWQNQPPKPSQGYGEGFRQQPQQQGYPQTHQQGHQRPPNDNFQGVPYNNAQQASTRWHPTQGRTPPPHRPGFNFRSFNQPPGPHRAPNSQQPMQQPSGVNANVMSSLKAQLASTLNKNRRPNDKR